jgi:hypothetical protein
MIRIKASLLFISGVFIIAAAPGTARALHLDVLSEQQNGRIVTGTGDFDHDLWTLGERVFHRDLNPTPATGATYLSNNNPGFNSIGAGSVDLPANSQPLPASSILSWDFLPMTINGLSQNLFYWNGQDTDGVAGLTPSDVKFGALPSPNYRLTLLDFNNGIHSVDGTNTIVPGSKIALTGSDGSMHQHLLFALQDNDGNDATLPVDGLYLIAIRLKIPGLQDSLPVFLIFGTPGSSISAEDDAAYPWVEQQLNLPGDFNQDGVVDAADYVLWRDTKGQTGAGLPADGNGDQTVNQADYDLWRANFGLRSQIIVNSSGGASGSLASGVVPEPSNLALLALGGAIVFCAMTGRSSANRRTPFTHAHPPYLRHNTSSHISRFQYSLLT